VEGGSFARVRGRRISVGVKKTSHLERNQYKRKNGGEAPLGAVAQTKNASSLWVISPGDTNSRNQKALFRRYTNGRDQSAPKGGKPSRSKENIKGKGRVLGMLHGERLRREEGQLQ